MTCGGPFRCPILNSLPSLPAIQAKIAEPRRHYLRAVNKAHHFVLSYNHKIDRDLSLKAELYYQYLFNVPVNANDTNTFSTLNIESSDYVSDPLTNKGTGHNYGLDLTLEKFLSNNLYYMVHGALYPSKYVALDGIERNTRFNGNHLFNGVTGKDYTWMNQTGRKKSFGVNIKLIYGGGYRDTPIDEIRSAIQTLQAQKISMTRNTIPSGAKW